MTRLCILAVLLCTSPLEAAFVVKQEYGNSDSFVALGIVGLEISGTTYAADFSGGYSTFDTLFSADNPPTFYLDARGAQAALAAIQLALNADPDVPDYVGKWGQDSSILSIPTQNGNERYYTALTLRKDNDAPWQTYWHVSQQAYAGDMYKSAFYGNVLVQFVELSVDPIFRTAEPDVTVPEPLTLTLWAMLFPCCALATKLQRKTHG